LSSKVIGFDYDSDPERFRANQQAVTKYNLQGDVHESVAQRLAEERLEPVLDLGCGQGRFTRHARALGIPIVALDYSTTMLKTVAAPRVQGDARFLPFPSGAFGAVAALYMLYHLSDPGEAIAESYRLLHPGGLFAASAPSRYNDPELAAVLGQSPETFDAESGPDLVGRYFQIDRIERWDTPSTVLPDHEALLVYLRGRGLPEPQIERAADRIRLPLTLTKRGALIWGRR
jgi:SAM-dependent methyltransferase